MAGLPWARLDSNIAQNDKILALKYDPSPKKWQAIAGYMMGIAWSVGQGTDGLIPKHALESIHISAPIARLLVKYGLWDEAVNGWWIRNFEERQQTSAKGDAIRNAQHRGAMKGNCIRHHGPDCGCWENS